MSKTIWKIKVVVFVQRSSVVEHSTADREVGGSILLVPWLKSVGPRVKQPVFFLENQTSKKEPFVIGKINIIINSRGCAMNAELQVAIKTGS